MTGRSQTGSAAEVLSDLRALRDHVRSSRILAGFMAFAGVAGGALLVFSLLAGANLVPLLRSSPARWSVLVFAAGVSAAAFAAWVLRPLLWNPTYEALARIAEEGIDGLDNCLINAVQLARERSSRSPFLLFRAIEECLGRARRFNILAAVERAPLRKAAIAAGAVFAALALYALVAPRNFAAGVSMLIRPNAFVPAVGRARISEVSPGDADVLRGDEITIEAVIEPALAAIPEAALRIRFPGDQPAEKPLLAVSPTQFRYAAGPAEMPFEYLVRVGGTEKGWFSITVSDRPAVRDIALFYEYPEYTGLGHAAFEGTSGDIRGPYGTRVTVTVESTMPVASGFLRFDGERLDLLPSPDAAHAAGSFLLTKDSAYRVTLADSRGRHSADNISRAVKVTADQAPSVSIPLPGRDMTAAAGSNLEMAVSVTDDYGVDGAELVLVDPESGVETIAHKWSAVASKAATLPFTLSLEADAFPAGSTLTYYARVVDGNTLTGPAKGESRRYQLKIVDAAAEQAELAEQLRAVFARLEKVLAAQEAAKEDADALAAQPAVAADGVSRLNGAQGAIRRETMGIAGDIHASGLPGELKRVLEGLAAGDMTKAIDQCGRLAGSTAVAGTDLAGLIETQRRIVSTLKQILEVVARLAEEAAEGELGEGSQIPSDVERKLQELLDKLREFLESQKRILEATSNLAAEPVDDYTQEQHDLLEELAAQEENWSRFLKEAWSDLSKLPQQDFADPTMLEDLVETFSEVEMAADALSREVVVMAVPHEQAGLELAEELTTHLEKWLTDAPDRLKWEMEEPLADIDVPMAELPTSLQDIVGDLMEQEEDLFSDIEDISSSWADSLDKGAGWDALDGPISNMSAQGVTGNVLPNASEIAGRSGEGRTGRTHGEFVGDSAVGKGGRRTPTRITPDDFLPGRVEDTSREAAGGATGGGKESGAGEEGLQGAVPRELSERIAALAGRQAQIVSRAQKLSIAMTLAGYPNVDIETALSSMEVVEESLRRGRLGNAIRQRPLLVKNLKNVQSIIGRNLVIRRDNSLTLPGELTEEIMDGAQGRSPRGYEDLLKGYYESLSVSE